MRRRSALPESLPNRTSRSLYSFALYRKSQAGTTGGYPMKSRFAFSFALAGIVSVISPQAFAKSKPEAAEPVPQIVRITYLEGDVRVSRGTEGGAPKDVDWEKAVANLPLQAGFTLATNDGRAEIEFEDASTVYLAPNSVLLFNTLESTANVPRTELALLSGTVTLGIVPNVKGDTFILRTPTDTMVTTYGQKSSMRVTAYVDAIGITPLESGFIRTSKDTTQIVRPGHTDYFRSGAHIDYADPTAESSFAAWDKWVTGRATERNQAIATLLKETGLKQPVPGLAQMAGQGKFVDCPGYGKCWQPPAPNASPLQSAGKQPQPAHALVPSRSAYTLVGEPAPPPTTAPNQQSPYGVSMMDADLFFPCGPESLFYRLALMQTMGLGMGMGMNMGMGAMGGYGYGGYGYMNSSWDWAVCHSGSWIYQQNQYLWVPGQTIHHQPPVRWISTGGKAGWVPIHPGDVAGKLPVNAQHGVITVSNRNRLTVEHTQFNLAGGVKLLDAAPREFRKAESPVLARTDAPHMEAHMIRAGQQVAGPSTTPGGNQARGGQIGAARPGTVRAGALAPGIDNKGGPGAGIPIIFDHRSQSFMMSRQVIQGSNIRTVNEPVGSYLARTGVAFGGHQGFENEPGGARNGGGFNGGNAGSTGFRGGGLAGGGPRGEPGGGYSAAGASRGSGGGNPGSGGNSGGYQGGGSQGGAGASRGGGGGAPSGGGSAPSSGAHR